MQQTALNVCLYYIFRLSFEKLSESFFRNYRKAVKAYHPMFNLLDITSGLLYLIFRIATLPGLATFYLFIGLWIVLKHAVQLERKLVKLWTANKSSFHWPIKRHLPALRLKWIRFQ